MCFRRTIEALWYHWNVMFIVVFEMFQKFSFFGFQCMMFLFLRHEMEYQLHNAIALYHIYLALGYLVPVIATMVADLYMHKVLLILLVSSFALLGNLLIVLVALAMTSHSINLLPYVWRNSAWFLGFGLFMRSLGGGGVKEIVRALGDDQFDDDEEYERNRFYQVLHYFMTFGTVTAFIILPVIRMHVDCYNQVYCFWLAILIPGAIIILAYVTILSGYARLHKPIPRESVIVEFVLCIQAALMNLWGGGLHWIDNASYAYTEDFLDDVKLTLHALALYAPLPFFWLVFEQIGSLWVFQATHLLGELNSDLDWYIEPDHMQVVNPIVVLIVMPLFSYWVYPACARIRCLMRTPTPRLFIGGLLLVLAAILATVVEWHILPTYEKPPNPDLAHVRIWNLLDNCSLSATIDDTETISVDKMDYADLAPRTIDDVQQFDYMFEAPLSCFDAGADEGGTASFNGTSYFVRGKMIQIVSLYTVDDESSDDEKKFMFMPAEDVIVHDPYRCVLQLPVVGIVYATHKLQIGQEGLGRQDQIYPIDLTVKFIATRTSYTPTAYYLDPNHNFIDNVHLHPSSYMLGHTTETMGRLKRGGVYVLLLKFSPNNESSWNSERIMLVPPINGTVWYVFPQYVLISTAQFLYPMTLLEFTYTQVPLRMRPVLLSAWFLSLGLGNLLISILTFFISYSDAFFYTQFWWFVLYLGVAVIDAIWLFIVLCNYNPVEDLDEDDY